MPVEPVRPCEPASRVRKRQPNQTRSAAPSAPRPAAPAPPPAPHASIQRAAIAGGAAGDLHHDWNVGLEDTLEVFRQALLDEPNDDRAGAPGTKGARAAAQLTRGKSVEKIRAVSDFAPIHERVKIPGKGRSDIVREGWGYHLTRWPLLAFIFGSIFIEFLWYLALRQVVNVMEYFSAWRGIRGQLRLSLRTSSTFAQWKDRALALDDHLGYSAWKQTPKNAFYDSALIEKVLEALRELREKDDAEGVRAVLEVAVRSNFAGVESYHLYSESFYGTKQLVEDYLDEIVLSLEFMRATTQISPIEKYSLFRSLSKNLGASALCLSGGASFAYYHFGVVRALLDEDLLPRVVTGTSAGALVAALVCTRTNEELKGLLGKELSVRINACDESIRVWMVRAYRTGARFDTLEWAKKATFFTLGSTTFKEAFERTGRILNVSVIPYDTHSPTKLLNYLTAPDCVIFSAVIASAAVPGIINPVVLLTKGKNGQVRPWAFQGKHKDGSLRVDIPLHALHLLYNVNFSIVSQVNPHIHLFHFASRGAPGRPVNHRSGKGWRGGFLLSASEQFLKLELKKNFRVIRDLELMPELGGQSWSEVFLQRFDGSVTVWPKSKLSDWWRILSDPDAVELERMIQVGRIATWPKIHMVENRIKIEREIDLGRQEAQEQLLALTDSRSAHLLLHRENSDDLAPLIDVSSRNGRSHEMPESHEVPSQNVSDESETELDREQVREVDDGSSIATETTETSRSTPIQRRQEILLKLGLQSNSDPGFSSLEHDSSSLGNGANGDPFGGGGGSVGRGLRGGRSRALSEDQMSRRYSLGMPRLAPRLRGTRESSLGVVDTSESEEERFGGSNGVEGAQWSGSPRG